MMDSFTLTGDAESISVRIKPLPACRVVPAMTWSQAADGEWGATDRGASEDYYEFDPVFYGTKEEMDNLAAFLENYGRGVISISQMSGEFFPPNVNQSGSISVYIPSRKFTEQTFYSPSKTGVQELAVTLRASGPDLLNSPDASLAALVLQEAFQADKTTTVTDVFAYDQSASVIDAANDAGEFDGKFMQDRASAVAILRYLLEAVRGSAFAFPTLPGVAYPFGVAMGGLPKQCRVTSFSIEHVDVHNWVISAKFAQSFV